MSLNPLENSKRYKIIGFLARKHGLNAFKTLISNKVYCVECVFTHALNPKSDDLLRSEQPPAESWWHKKLAD